MESYFPEQGDPQFQRKISALQEYQLFQSLPTKSFENQKDFLEHVDNVCNTFEKTTVQSFAQHYISKRSPYRGILLFHGLGVGKTCSAITVAESMLQNGDEQVWAVMSTALQKSFHQQLFDASKLINPAVLMDQCTGDQYVRMAKAIGPYTNQEELIKRIDGLIKKRYKLMTYDRFFKEVVENGNVGKNVTLIIDEAHNLRSLSSGSGNQEKDVARALVKFAEEGTNNRIVLLSATPMFNEASEIVWLLGVLAKNDKIKSELSSLSYNEEGTLTEKTKTWIKQMSSQYISYIRGVNPFTFAKRLSPKDSGYDVSYDQKIDGGLYVSPMSESHAESLEIMRQGDNVFNVKLHEYTNLKTDYNHDTKTDQGLKSFLTGNTKEQSYKYNEKYNNPDKYPFKPGKNLQSISPKINAICNLIKKSEGIVVIYSQFVKKGVLAVAFALEHMGFRRFGKENLLMKYNDIPRKERAVYPEAAEPTYTILTGDKDVMGGQKIESLINHINNSSKNLRGEMIKVVLMTPVTSEGITLKNVREVHILDPWYHLNRLEQVIGRALRTCSHVRLPLNERNVTVFLHASGSADIHTYTDLAAKKVKEVNEIIEIIRDNAIDCSLQKHVNYFPKSLFGFDIEYRSSRGKQVTKNLGDDELLQPRCADPDPNPDTSSMRISITGELSSIGLQRLRKYINRFHKTLLTEEDIQDALRMHPMVVEEVLRRAQSNRGIDFIYNHRFYKHRGMYFIEPLTNLNAMAVQKLRVIPRVEEPDVVPSENNKVVKEFGRIFEESEKQGFNKDDKNAQTCWLYLNIRIDTWNGYIQEIVQSGKTLLITNAMNMYIPCLVKQGVLIEASELPNVYNPGKSNFIGYLDVFANPSDIEGYICTFRDNNKFRLITSDEKEKLQSNRELKEPPHPPKYSNTEAIGMLAADNKEHIFKFKIFNENSKKMGSVCTTQSIAVIDEKLKLLTTEQPGTKDMKCKLLMVKLLELGYLYMAPFYKPKSKPKPKSKKMI